MNKEKIGRILAIATGVCAGILGILFIISCAHLYFTGGDVPYTRERVGEYLVWLIAPSIITILLAAGGIIFNVITGEVDTKNVKRTNIEQLKSYESRYDVDSFNKETIAPIIKEKNSRKLISIICYSVSALLFVLSLIYIAFIADFTVENLNADIIAAISVALPLAAIGVAIHIPRIYYVEVSAARELDALKAFVKDNGIQRINNNNSQSDKQINYQLITRCVVVAASLILIILGIFNGGMNDVIQKAVKICTECIGLG